MNIPKAMKIGSGQTELKLDVVLHATAKKKEMNIPKTKGIVTTLSRRFSYLQWWRSAWWLSSLRTGFAWGQDSTVPGAARCAHQSASPRSTAICTHSCSAWGEVVLLCFPQPSIGRWFFVLVFSIGCSANWPILFLAKPFTYPVKVSRADCGPLCCWQCRAVSRGCSHCGAPGALG